MYLSIAQKTNSLYLLVDLIKIESPQKLWHCLLLLILTYQLPAQETDDFIVHHQSIGKEQLLRNDIITDCLVDSLGFYWLVGGESMCRFDGDQCMYYTKTDFGLKEEDQLASLQLPNHQFLIFSKNRAAGFYSVAHPSVQFFDPIRNTIYQNEAFWSNAPFEKEEITQIYNSNGKILLVTEHKYVYELVEEQFLYLFKAEEGRQIRKLDWMPTHKLFFYQSDSSLYQYDLSKQRSLKIDNLKARVLGFIVLNNSLVLHVSLPSTPLVTRAYHYSPLNGQTTSIDLDVDLKYLGKGEENSLFYTNQKTFYQLQVNNDASLDTLLAIPLNQLTPKRLDLDRAFFIQQKLWLCSYQYVDIVSIKPPLFEPLLKESPSVSVRDVLQLNDSILFATTYAGFKHINLNSLTVKPANNLLRTIPGYKMFKRANVVGTGLHTLQVHLYDVKKDEENVIPFLTASTGLGREALFPFADADGQWFIGMNQGMGYFKSNKDSFMFVHLNLQEINEALLNDITPTHGGRQFWLSTSKGAFLFDSAHKSIIDSIPAFSDKDIISITCEEDGQLWIVPAQDDVYKIDRDNKKVDTLKLYRKDWGNNFHTIQKDQLGYYWLPSDNGLFRYDPIHKRARRYTQQRDGLPSNEFNKIAWEMLTDGRIVLGGINGIVLFDPQRIAKEQLAETTPKVHFTKVEAIIDGQQKNYPYQDFIQENSHLYFPTQIEQLLIQFRTINIFSEDVNYIFRLNPKSDNTPWTKLDQPRIVLNAFSFGDQILEIAIEDKVNQRILTKTTLSFSVAYPWYLQNWALLLFIVTIGGLIGAIINIRTNKIIRENLKLEKIVAQRTFELESDKAIIAAQNDKLDQLNTAKNKLFAIIGHELRQPLLGVVNTGKKVSYLLKKQEWDGINKISRQLDHYARDTQTMLQNLLNWGEIMVLEGSGFVEHVQLLPTIKDVIEKLHDYSADKQIKIEYNIPTTIQFLYDEEALRIIMRNLIQNAIKFSPIGNTVFIQCEHDVNEGIQISIIDTGAGISSEMIEKWQNTGYIPSSKGTAGEKGIGIGLQLCRSLAKENKSRLFFRQPAQGGTEAVLEIHLK